MSTVQGSSVSPPTVMPPNIGETHPSNESQNLEMMIKKNEKKLKREAQSKCMEIAKRRIVKSHNSNFIASC